MMRIFLLVLVWLSAMAGMAVAEVLPKLHLVVDGKKYAYADCLIVTTGIGGKSLYYIIVHAEEAQYSDVNLIRSEKRPWPPRLSSASADVPLPVEGVYLVRKIEGRLRVDLIAGGPPMTEERKRIEAYIGDSVRNPPIPPDEK